MSGSLSNLAAELPTPARLLAFCDETDLTGDATSTMVADIHLHAAIVLPSDGYADLASEITAALQAFAVAEFHAVDIVMNGKKSVWKKRERAERVAALEMICDLLCRCGGHIYYVHIPKEQYAGFVAALSPVMRNPDHKVAVKIRFRELVADLLDTPRPAIVIADKDKNTSGPGLAKFDGSDHHLGGGIILAHSHEVLGLQLADVATYVIGRYIRRRDGMVAMVAEAGENALDPFDKLVAATVGRLSGRLHSLLSQPALHCLAA